MTASTVETIRAELASGVVIPYLGAGVLALAGEDCPLPASPEVLVARLTAKASVPFKIRKNLTAAAQFIENFKHRKTVVKAMTEAFSADVPPTTLHRSLASIPSLKLLVHAWYDDLPQKALADREGWGIVQGVAQSEHYGEWVHYFSGGERRDAAEASSWMPLLYQPLGSVSPAANYLVSDFGLRRGADRNRHPDANSRSRAEDPQGPKLPLPRLPFFDPGRARLPAADHQAVLGPALGGAPGGADTQRSEVHGAVQYPAHRDAARRICCAALRAKPNGQMQPTA